MKIVESRILSSPRDPLSSIVLYNKGWIVLACLITEQLDLCNSTWNTKKEQSVGTTRLLSISKSNA